MRICLVQQPKKLKSTPALVPYRCPTADLVYESPVSGKAHHPQLDKDKDSLQYLADLVKNAESGLPPSSPSSPAGAPKHNANSVRICNNTLMSLVALDRVLYHILDDPAELIWLDASCNQLSSIEDVILKFPKLQVSTS